MFEAEIKILGIERKSVLERLAMLGAKLAFEGEIHALYYDDTCNSLRNRKDALRLRKEGEKVVLTFKKYIENPDAKVRMEKEVSVSDFEETRAILEGIGFTPWLEMRKLRTTYQLPGVRFELDRHVGEYGFIPEFLEIEAGNSETVFKYAEALGFSKDDCRPWDAVQVAQFYSRQSEKN